MTQDELNKILKDDPYHLERKSNSEVEIRYFLREVNYHCPLCGLDLDTSLHKNKEGHKEGLKNFQIAHIYPNRPTVHQYEVLDGLERLGDNSESLENKIALCRNCHATQDYQTSKKDYLKLLNIKKHLLNKSALDSASDSLGLEPLIADVVQKLASLDEEQLGSISYKPVPIANKFSSKDNLLKSKISGYVTEFYPYIKVLFSNSEEQNHTYFNVLSLQIKTYFTKMENIDDNKSLIFEQMAKWIQQKTQSKTIEPCEAIVAFFVQNCEVFHEITK